MKLRANYRMLICSLLLAVGTLAGEPVIGQLELTRAPAADAYRLIGKLCGLNVVVDDSVEGQITVSLRDVPLGQALDSITRSRGDAYRLDDNLLLVSSAEVFASNYQDSEVEIFSLSYANTAEVASALSLVVGKGQVMHLAGGRQLVVRGSRSQLALAKTLVNSLDQGPSQLDFVVRLEEVTRTGLEELGASWNFPGLYVQKESNKLWVGLGYEPILAALEEQGQATTLERITITALEGRAASTLIGERVPIVVEEVVEGKVTRQLIYIDAGVKLKLTPELEVGGQITVTVEPEVSSISGWTPQGYPKIKTRQSSTTLQLADGQTAILSGLVEKKELESWTSVPILGKIPFFGRLFQRKKTDTVESEIIMLITPALRKDEEASP